MHTTLLYERIELSYIAFNSKNQEAHVRGPERRRAGFVCFELFWVSLGIRENPLFGDFAEDPILNMLENRRIDYKQAWVLKTMLRSDPENVFFEVDERQISVFDAMLSTAYAVGNDVVKLMARLYAQCELNCYVEALNRNWLSDIIERGREVGLLRSDCGWEEVVELLRAGDDSPVVATFSGSNRFPDLDIALNEGTWEFDDSEDETSDRLYEAWEALGTDKQWGLAMAALRKQEARGDLLELSPDSFAIAYPFGSVNGFDIRRFANSLYCPA